MLRKTSITALFLSCFLFLSSMAVAAPSTGSFTGSIHGPVTDANGVTQQLNGSVDATVAITTAANGSPAATITGTASSNVGLGVSVSFTATYNPATNALTGTYSDAGSATSNPIVFTFNGVGGALSWSATISGTAPSPSGPLPYTGLIIDISLSTNAIYPGATLPAAQTFTGPLAGPPLTVNVPLGAPINQTITIAPVISGSWTATAVPQMNGTVSFTGTVSGSLATTAPTIVTVPTLGGPINIPVSINATFNGNLFTNAAGALEFQGNWVDASGNGGPMGFTVPINPNGSITSLNFNFTGGFTVSTPIGPFPVPFTASGSIPFTVI